MKENKSNMDGFEYIIKRLSWYHDEEYNSSCE